jgi:TonB family protein
MAPISKDTEVLTAPTATSSAVSTPIQPRHEDTATGSKPQPVALEVPVTVNGARTVEGSDKREPFSETTKTVLVFGNGAVIRLGSPVAAGQLLFLTNEKTKKEVVCQVVKSRNYKSVSGYVELEFTESVVGFWGMRFPSDRIGTQAPASAPIASVSPVLRTTPVLPVAAANKPVSPVVSTTPKIPEIKPVQTHAPQVHAEVKPAPQSRPADVIAGAPPLPKPQAPSVQTATPTVAPVAKKPEAPVIPAPAASSSSLASSLASLLGAPEVPSAATTLKTPTSPLPSQNKQQPSSVAGDNSSEELKQQAARLQEQLSSLLFNAAPAAKLAAPPVPAPDPKVVSGVAAQVLEIAKSEPAPVKAAPPAKNPPAPIKSSLDTGEVKIPSWLEPLARNAAAAPPTQEPTDREKAKHADEIPVFEEHPVEPLSDAATDSTPEVELPGIGSLLPLEEGTATHDHTSNGSNKGVLYGAIAAAVLLVAGGAWYFLHPANAVQSTSAPITSAPSTQVNAASPAPAVTQPPAQPPVSQSSVVVPEPASRSNAAPVSNTLSPSAPLTKPRETSQPAPVTRDNTRSAGAAIPAAATERIPRVAAEPEPKKPALGEVHLASPKMNRPATSQSDGVDAPTIPAGNADANAGELESGFSTGTGRQPAAPEAPLPIGGDVKAAELISRVSPVYPPLARNQHVSGDVRIDALIDANGRVTTMKVISGPTLLHQAAMDALRQWKYQPATLDGKQVPMHLTVTLQFRLQ